MFVFLTTAFKKQLQFQNYFAHGTKQEWSVKSKKIKTILGVRGKIKVPKYFINELYQSFYGDKISKR